jgi:hypothetical protein
MTARTINIGPDKFLSVPGQEGSISHQPLTKFRELYGVNDATIALFARLFGTDVSKAEQEQRMRELTADEKSRLLVALDKRIRDMVRDLQQIQGATMTLGSTVLMSKLSKIKAVRDKIADAKPGADTSGLARPPMARPAESDVLENEIVQVPAGADADATAVAQAKKVRANLFQRIMTIAYYLAHPVQLHRRDPQLYDNLRQLVEGLVGPKTPEQMTKMVTMIQEGATSADIKSMDPLNYFEHVSMSAFLESPDLAEGATNAIINPLKESTQERVMASYVTKLMALLQIEGMINKDSMKALKDYLKGKLCDEETRGARVEMGKKLSSAIQPLYEAFERMYSPLFTKINEIVNTITPAPSMQIMNMLKVITDPRLPDGIYKYTNVPANVMDFFNKINTNYAMIQQYTSQLKLRSTNKIQYVYLHDNLPIPNTSAQIVFSQIGGKRKENGAKATEVVQQASQNPVFASMQQRIAAQAGQAPQAPQQIPKAPRTTDKKEGAVITRELEKLDKEITKETQVTKKRVSEAEKQVLLNKIKSFFADKENTLYIMSGKQLEKIPVALFTISAESPLFTEIPTPEYNNSTMKVANIFPSIANSKPVATGTIMLAGFIAFAKSLKTIADEPVAPAPAVEGQ